jgi:hypothetical protein
MRLRVTEPKTSVPVERGSDGAAADPTGES